MPPRRLVLVVMLIGSICAACGQGTTATSHTGGGSAIGSPAAMSPIPSSPIASPAAATTPTCPQRPPAAGSTSPTAAADSASPTADASGQYHQLTFAQAQQLASFHLAQPSWLPPCLRVAEIVASVPNLTEFPPNPPLAGARPTTTSVPATPPTRRVQLVRLSFMGPDPNEFTVVINELKDGTPLGPAIGQNTPGGNTTMTRLTISGHQVTRTTWPVTAVYPQSGPNAVYVWADQGTTFQLSAILDYPTTEPNVEHMIASMLQ